MVLPNSTRKISTLPAKTTLVSIEKIKVEECKISEATTKADEMPAVTTLVSVTGSFNIPFPNRLSSSSTPMEPTPFIGPTLPANHPLSTTQNIPLPSKELSQEEKFQPIGPNDPLVFKTKTCSTTEMSNESLGKEKQDTNLAASFVIPPEQAERYRALRLQAERHARKVMGELTEEEDEEMADSSDVSTSTSNGGNPQQQLVEELYLEQMAALMAQQQQQQQLVVSSQAPVGRLVHIVGGQQNVAATPQLIPVVQFGAKVVSALPQAGAPLILAQSNATGHITTAAALGAQPRAGNTLVQVQAEDALQARTWFQQARIELTEKAMAERQEWVQIVQLPQQHSPSGVFLAHPMHHHTQLGVPIIQRPNIIIGASRKAPALIQVPTGQVVAQTLIGAQQVLAAQHAPQVSLPIFLGANGQVLIPKFMR